MGAQTYWLFMVGAISFEVAGTISLKISDGFTKPMFVVLTVVAYVVSFTFMGLALKGLPVSTVYALWAGVGTALVAIIGIAAFGEPTSAIKVASILMIIMGVVGLHFAERLV